ncbi:putative glutathione transferase [Helianthus annuus]|nr:putative glutathione transferase [Helianthus annuus]KAJ0663932.1 putative glutathione transferase [Helianthus annuus]KAJ0858473.1 putative glutathione transferase [Helianthus annuus]
MEPNAFSQFYVNAFAGFQQSPNAFSNTQQMLALQNLMIRNPFNMQPVQSSQLPQPVQSSQPLQPVEDDIEVIPETQPQSSKRKKGKQVAVDQNQQSKTKPKLWTRIEEEALAKVYISTSTHPAVGNNQTGERFWKATLSKFLAIMEQGPYRDVDSISSKWRKMNPIVNRFAAIYNNLYTSHRRSGMSDEDVFKPRWINIFRLRFFELCNV